MAYYGRYKGGQNSDWVDIIATHAAGASGKVILIQNRSKFEPLFVVFGGSKPTVDDAGFILGENEVIWGSGTAVWVRGSEGYNIAVMDKE